jgi:hypothetical protein
MSVVRYVSIHSIIIPHCVATAYKVPHLVDYTSSLGEKAEDIQENYVGRYENREEIEKETEY